MTDTKKPETALVLRRDLTLTKFIVSNDKGLENIIKAVSRYSLLGFVFPIFGAVVTITPYALKLISNELKKSNINLISDKSISESEAKEINDAEYEDINYVQEILQKASETVKDPEILRSIDERLEKIEKMVGNYSKLYESNYGVKPVVKQANTAQNYTDEGFAKYFIEYALREHNQKPSQNELANHTGGSQATWSRAMKRAEFWGTVQTNLEIEIKKLDINRETLFSLDQLADDELSRIKVKSIKNKEIPIDQDIVQTVGNANDNDDQSKRELAIDLRMKLEKLPMEKLVKAAKDLSPAIKTDNLERMTREALIDLIEALAVS